jgi:hypothetical protein
MPASLISLDLRGARLALDGWQRMLELALFQRIERLALWVEPALGDPFAFLSRQPHLANLRYLWLGGFPGERFHRYGTSLRDLRHLVVQGDNWFDQSRSHQPDDPEFPELVTLRQEYLRVGTDLIDLLCRSDRWPALRVLEFRRWQSSDPDDVPRLIGLSIVPALKRLELPGLPDSGFDASLGEHALAELTLSAVYPPTSIAAISRSDVLPNLVSLEIARARLDRPDDLEPLLDRSRFPCLRRLEIGGLTLDEALLRRFIERFGPGVSIVPHSLTAFPVNDRLLENWL